MTAMLPGNAKIVVALDVGTTYSGYAYSFVSKPDNIITCSFAECPPNKKTPSSLLLNKGGKFVAYGQEAEERFAQLCSRGNVSHLLFRNFKMILHHNNTLNKTTKVADITDRYRMPVFDLLVMSVRYLKNQAMKALNRFSDTYSEDDVWFVLLVPGIFDDRAKWFMREVALQAGIKSNGFVMALESEASSLWCQHENIGGVREKGSKYVTVDLGGGTCDIIVHEAQGDGSVDALSAPCGGDWGAITADNSFKAYLTLLFGTSSVENLRKVDTTDWFRIIRDYENRKTSAGRHKDKGLEMKVPPTLLQSAVADKGLHGVFELAELVKSPSFGGHFKLLGETLQIDAEASKGLYSYTVNSQVVKLEELLHKGVLSGKNISGVIMTGGLADSEIVQGLVKDRFKRAAVHFVQDSQLFALKGAVLYGLNQNLIKSRIVPVTYGIKATVPYKENLHFGSENAEIGGVKLTTEHFTQLITAGTKVTPGFQVKHTDKPLTADDKEQLFEIYSCGQADDIPTLTSHCSVHREASFSVPLPYGCQTVDKVFERCVVFGEPELSFRITFQKGKKESFCRKLIYEQ